MTPEQRRQANLAAALAALDGGWEVFALAGGKVPFAGTHGHLDATADRATVERWMRRPGAVPGIAIPADVAVLDFDPRNGGSPSDLGLDPADADVRTPSGGWHFYFYEVDLPLRNGLLPGVDLKARGGYVVAPGSVLPDGRAYEGEAVAHPMPEALAARISLALGERRGDREPLDESEPITSRDQILRLAGGWRRAGMSAADIEAALLARLAAGSIQDADPDRPWRPADLVKIAREMGAKPGGEGAWQPTLGPNLARRLGAEPEPSEPEGADEFRSRMGAVLLSQVDRTPPPPLVLDRLHPTSQTILFGMGGTGKGTLAAWWLRGLTDLGERVLVVDYEGHADEWARRSHAFGAGLDQVLIVEPYKVGLGRIWECAGELARLAADFGADRLFVDSIVAACGEADALDSRSPGLYAQAIQRIALPSLNLGHVTKQSAERPAWPFGSVFWHNWARITWSLEGQNGDPRTLTNRKTNTHSAPPPIEIEWAWSVVPGAPLPDRLVESSALDKPVTAEDSRTVEAVGAGATVREIAELLGVSGPTARRRLKDLAGRRLLDEHEDVTDGRKTLWYSVPWAPPPIVFTHRGQPA